MAIIHQQLSSAINRAGVPKLTIWQDFYKICIHARTPYCAAAILDLLEQHPPSTVDGWIIISFEAIYDALFGAFWLKTIKHHIRWLAEIGYIACLHDPNNDYGLQAYRLNTDVIQQAISCNTR